MKALHHILILLMLAGFVPSIAQDTKAQTAEFKVTGNCDMCKKTIESSVVGKAGINEASWNKGSKKMKVNYDPDKISIPEIHQLIANSGYDTEEVKADDKAYKNLHHCCQYKRILHK